MAALLLTAGMLAMPLCARAHSLLPGDRLTYDVTVEAQEHSVPANADTSEEATVNSVGAGTETIVIDSVDARGRAHAGVTLDIQGRSGDAPIAIHRTVPATITPIGEILIGQSVDPLIDQALLLANQGVRDFASRTLSRGVTWRLSARAAAYPMTIEYERSAGVTGKFRGLPTVPIASVGAGDYASPDPAQPLTASTTISGTYYYDQRDRLFIGEALRNDVLVSSGAHGAHVNSSTTINIVLRSLERAKPPASATPAASAAPSVSPTPIETPTAVPTGLRSEPAPTVTPSIH